MSDVPRGGARLFTQGVLTWLILLDLIRVGLGVACVCAKLLGDQMCVCVCVDDITVGKVTLEGHTVWQSTENGASVLHKADVKAFGYHDVIGRAGL